MSARDDILGRVRRGVGKDDFVGRREAAVAAMQTLPRGPRPAMSADLVSRFQGKAEYLSSSVEAVPALAAAPAAVARYLAANGLPGEAVATADVGGLAWADSALRVAVRPAVDADKTGISGCFCGIAETGMLMLLSGPDSPATVSLLPETHIALVAVSRIVATMEDAYALLKAERGTLPRAVNFISGPSRTGDIEQTIVLGAHGPCRVHLILIGELL
ncbi:lactate utilization protein C [Dechloromonas sp. HYN0024]|uniref:LutC/YkgG family protein n=1 Tax=Dechloromonas sp. HYN0024 TaxID=2231055 RepID=UPI000E43CF0B|nr:lactate utilization protein C [Dechloromonas sp. HYN0024]AXS79122.1 lactate utilization protein C [Dechloromonas sp. HYN0024]